MCMETTIIAVPDLHIQSVPGSLMVRIYKKTCVPNACRMLAKNTAAISPGFFVSLEKSDFTSPMLVESLRIQKIITMSFNMSAATATVKVEKLYMYRPQGSHAEALMSSRAPEKQKIVPRDHKAVRTTAMQILFLNESSRHDPLDAILRLTTNRQTR
mmetsp:Transcript_17403/g.47507  ORF Transcript_17403/g.47507 Transcript_17403/m.47507 type:complete len:157 (+) Transcript_17403:994-1464(+)